MRLVLSSSRVCNVSHLPREYYILYYVLHRDSALTRLNALSVHGVVCYSCLYCNQSGVNIQSADVCSRTNSV